jgi:mannose-6-phosphate isomerase-like protein (cupin superfamily)
MTTPETDPDSREFATTVLAADRFTAAPDGSDVRVLTRLADSVSMAHFEIGPGQTSVAVHHRSVGELWFVLRGRGAMWRRDAAGGEEVVELRAGTSVSIPLGTQFQFRSFGHEPLSALGVTVPGWPIDPAAPDEAIAVRGRWEATLEPGPGLGRS